jgi:hypothetical protein
MQQGTDSRLSAASAATKERQEHLRRERINARTPAVRGADAAVERVLGPALTKAGFDIAAFDKARLEHTEQIRRAVQEQRIALSRQHAEESHRFARLARQRADDLANVRANIGPADTPSPYYVWLPTPNATSATSNITVHSENIVAYNSTAKIELYSGAAAGYDEFTFQYIWENPSDRYAVINADGFMAFDGFGNAFANGGFFPGDRQSSITVTASLNISELWTTPPTNLYPTYGTSEETVLSVSASAGGFLSTADSETQTAYRGYDLGYQIIPIPPNGALSFDLTLGVQYGSSDGDAFLDAYTGSYEVSGFGILVAILT